MAEETAKKGVLPKNLQTWVLLGITVLVIAVILFAGRGNPKPNIGAMPTPTPTPINEFESRATQMALDQEKLLQRQREIQELTDALARQQASPPPEAGQAQAVMGGSDDELKKSQQKREYTSLFASQLVSTYDRRSSERAGTAAVEVAENSKTTSEASNTEADQAIAKLHNTVQDLERQAQLAAAPLTSALAAASTAPAGTVAPARGPASPDDFAPARRDNTARNQLRPGAHEYVLTEGTVIETALVTRLVGEFAGPVSVQVTAPVYSKNRQQVLIPAGSRVLGEARKTQGVNENRLAVAFHRVIMPDGYSVDLDRFTGLGSRGEAALSDQVNHHYLQMFGSSIALGLIGGLSALGANSPSLLDSYRIGVASSFGQVAGKVLERFTNVMPTITIREGHRVRVWISQDLALPPYAAHQMASDF
jgi:type IV secretory pathway VirB10-like protein